MTAVAAASVPVRASASPQGSGGAASSLVPEPLPLTGPGIDDALGLLYAAMAQLRHAGLRVGVASVDSAHKAQQVAIAKEEEARKQEEANEASHGSGLFASIGRFLGDVSNDVVHLRLDSAVKDGASDVSHALNSPAFWSDLEQGALWVAKVAAVVGSAALTVATGGAAAVTIAGAALLVSVGGEVVARTKCFGKDSETIGLGMEIGGAVAGLGTTFLSSTATMGGGIAKALGTAANTVSAGATGVAGAAHIENAEFAARAQSAAADATEASHKERELQQVTSWVIDEMKADDKSRQRGLQATQGAIEANDKAEAAATPVALKG
jgi:hypothetical protein